MSLLRDRHPVRLPNVILERLNDAAARHRITAAEVVRRALRRYTTESRDGVVALPKRMETTRTNSKVVKLAGVTKYSFVSELGQIITWYLDTYDNGKDYRPDVADLLRLAGVKQVIIEEAP